MGAYRTFTDYDITLYYIIAIKSITMLLPNTSGKGYQDEIKFLLFKYFLIIY